MFNPAFGKRVAAAAIAGAIAVAGTVATPTTFSAIAGAQTATQNLDQWVPAYDSEGLFTTSDYQGNRNGKAALAVLNENKTVAPGGDLKVAFTIDSTGAAETKPKDGINFKLLGKGGGWQQGLSESADENITFSTVGTLNAPWELADGKVAHATFVVPLGLANGEYELRLLAQSGFSRGVKFIVDDSKVQYTLGTVSHSEKGNTISLNVAAGLNEGDTYVVSVDGGEAQTLTATKGRRGVALDAIKLTATQALVGQVHSVTVTKAGAEPVTLRYLVDQPTTKFMSQTLKGVADSGVGSTANFTVYGMPDGATITGMTTSSAANLEVKSQEAAKDGMITGVAVIPDQDALIGSTIKVNYMLGDGTTASYDTGIAITPSVAELNADQFEVQTAKIKSGLYQPVYDNSTNQYYVTRAVGRPPIADSSLVTVNASDLTVAKDTQVADAETNGKLAAYGVAYDSKRKWLWVTNTRQNTISAYDVATNTLQKKLGENTIMHPRDIVYDAKNDKVLVSAFQGDDALVVVDPEAGIIVDQVGKNKAGLTDAQKELAVQGMGMDYDAQTGMAYLVTYGKGLIKYDAATEKAEVMPLPADKTANPSDVAVDTKRNVAYIPAQATHNAIAVSLTDGSLLADIPTGAGALYASYDAVNDLVYVANRGAGTLTVINPATKKKVANLAVGKYPNGTNVDGHGNLLVVNKANVPDEQLEQNVDSFFKVTPKAEWVASLDRTETTTPAAEPKDEATTPADGAKDTEEAANPTAEPKDNDQSAGDQEEMPAKKFNPLWIVAILAILGVLAGAAAVATGAVALPAMP